MKFRDLPELENNLILEKRKYNHRQGYTKNQKSSYINKGKTLWDYSSGQTPGNERIVSQIQIKAQELDKYLTREEIKKYLKSESSQKLYNKLVNVANYRFGHDEESEEWKAYVYGGFVKSAAKILSKDKKSGMTYLL